MTPRLDLVLVRGDLSVPQLSRILARLGRRPTGRVRTGVCGPEVHRVETQLLHTSPAPCEVVRLASLAGWTLLADGSGALSEELAAWRDLSRRLRTRIVTARHDELGVEFALLDHGRCVRLASWDVEEGRTTLGAPLAGEHLFRQECPDLPELVALVSSLAFDLRRVDDEVRFSLLETERVGASAEGLEGWLQGRTAPTATMSSILARSPPPLPTPSLM